MPRTLAARLIVVGFALLLRATAGADGGETCSVATPITALPFQDTGDTTGRSNDRALLPNGCSVYVDVPGPEVVYQLPLEAGNDLVIGVTPNGAWDPSIYLYRGCGAGDVCVGGSDNNAGQAEQLSVAGLAAGTYFLYVDSFYADAPLGFGSFTLSVSGSLGGATTTVTTTTTTTSTTAPMVNAVCTGGAPMRNAKVKLAKLGGPPHTQTFVLSGTLVLPADRPAAFVPAAQGVQLLLEDLSAAPPALLDFTAAATPVPPGAPGSGCAAEDGWKKSSYRNRSGALDPPVCTPGSARGLDAVRLKDLRAKGVGVVFRAHGHGASLAAPTGPLRLTVVLSAQADAGARGECGSHVFAADACRSKKKRLQCR